MLKMITIMKKGRKEERERLVQVAMVPDAFLPSEQKMSRNSTLDQLWTSVVD